MSASPTPVEDMRIFFNDVPCHVGTDTRLADVFERRGLAVRAGIAAAVNGVVVPRRDWAARALCAGDRIIVIQAAQGG